MQQLLSFSVQFGGRGGEGRWEKAIFYLYHSLAKISQKHQRNGVNPTLKQKRWSAERKHNNTQRTSWGEVGETVQI